MPTNSFGVCATGTLLFINPELSKTKLENFSSGLLSYKHKDNIERYGEASIYIYIRILMYYIQKELAYPKFIK